jgi:hypothetical protein
VTLRLDPSDDVLQVLQCNVPPILQDGGLPISNKHLDRELREKTASNHKFRLPCYRLGRTREIIIPHSKNARLFRKTDIQTSSQHRGKLKDRIYARPFLLRRSDCRSRGCDNRELKNELRVTMSKYLSRLNVIGPSREQLKYKLQHKLMRR